MNPPKLLISLVWIIAYVCVGGLNQGGAQDVSQSSEPSVPELEKAQNLTENQANVSSQAPIVRRGFTLLPPRPDDTPEERAQRIRELRAYYEGAKEQWPKPTLDDGVEWMELGTPERAPIPERGTPEFEKIQLGLSLFFDPRLSGSQEMSCASCHEPQLGWSDSRSFGIGKGRQNLKRHTPALVGLEHAKSYFWDGRAKTLEEQAAIVIQEENEMDADPDEVVSRLKIAGKFYEPKFEKAFGDADITFKRITQALAAFQRSLPVGRSAFDRFIAGQKNALSDSAILGLHLFRTTARCMNCHHGPMFSDYEFYNAGLTYYGRKYEDLGRYHQTQKIEDIGRFRTPTLRNVGRTAPYMHNGLFPELAGVLRLYNAGMPRPPKRPEQENDPMFPVTDPKFKPLGLNSADIEDLKDFLLSLNEPQMRVLTPPFPPLDSDGSEWQASQEANQEEEVD